MKLNQEQNKKRLKNVGYIFMRTLLLVGFSYIILYPIVIMFSRTFMAQQDIFDNSVLWVPKHFTLDNLKIAAEGMDYFNSLWKTILISFGSMILQVIPCLMAGYSFARYQFKGNSLLFAVVIFTILVPPQQFLTPFYLHFSSFDIFGIVKLLNNGNTLNLTSTPIPYIILSATGFGLKNGLFIFLFRQSFKGMPKELEEAAYVDGAGQFRTFVQIMLPSAITVTVTVMLFSLVWQYNDTYYSGLLLSDVKTLPVAYSVFNSSITGWNGDVGLAGALSKYVLDDPKVLSLLRNSAMFLIITPLLVVYFFAQKFFIQSIDQSGLVG